MTEDVTMTTGPDFQGAITTLNIAINSLDTARVAILLTERHGLPMPSDMTFNIEALIKLCTEAQIACMEELEHDN